MSMGTSRLRGIGFDVAGTTRERFQRFMEFKGLPMKSGRIAEVRDAVKGMDEEKWEDYTSNPENLGAMAKAVAQVIWQETEIDMTACGVADDGSAPCVFEPRYPWENSRRIRDIQKDELTEQLAWYAEQLGIDLDEEFEATYTG